MDMLGRFLATPHGLVVLVVVVLTGMGVARWRTNNSKVKLAPVLYFLLVFGLIELVRLWCDTEEDGYCDQIDAHCGGHAEWETLVGLESAVALSVWFGVVWLWKEVSSADDWKKKKWGLAWICGAASIGLGQFAANRFLHPSHPNHWWHEVFEKCARLDGGPNTTRVALELAEQRLDQVARYLLGFTLSAGFVLLSVAYRLQLPARTEGEPEWELDTHPDRPLRRLRKLDVVLHAGAALFVSMMIESNAMVRWALPNDREVANSLMLTRGVIGTFLLVAIYLPAYISIERTRVRPSGSGPAVAMSTEKGAGWVGSSLVALVRVLYLLAPLLTGKASEVLSRPANTVPGASSTVPSASSTVMPEGRSTMPDASSPKGPDEHPLGAQQ